MPMKKILFIVILAVLALVAAFLSWHFFSSDSGSSLGETIIDVLPFGSGDNTSLPPDTTTNTNTGNGGETGGEGVEEGQFNSPQAKLVRITEAPVAGFVVFNKSGIPFVRYVDRATGHITDVPLETSTTTKAFEKTKITNTTHPKIYEAYFRGDGNAVLLRYLEQDTDIIENLSLSLAPSQGTTTSLYTASSTFIRGDIGSVAVGTGNTLLYFLKDTYMLTTSNFNGSGAKDVLYSRYKSWQISANGPALVMYPKASASALGYAYIVNTTNGGLTKIAGPLKALTTNISTSSNKFIYSYIDGNNVARMFIKNRKDNSEIEFSNVTLAEKCVWSTLESGVFYCASPDSKIGSNEPDKWYQGVTHFSDRIWKYNSDIDTLQMLAEPKKDPGVSIDIIEPKLSQRDRHLVFINKTDLSLWALKLVD